ncbi:unnamed protein product [Pleuronectes platessa]|uniref:Uncharacterized protein n=1 Tax=Pleuronectes platessa TaxID=8262 RepID=A0A9N7UBM0_PLEPL|nr:unnamed protein product [Pleuronectes platessa]
MAPGDFAGQASSSPVRNKIGQSRKFLVRTRMEGRREGWMDDRGEVTRSGQEGRKGGRQMESWTEGASRVSLRFLCCERPPLFCSGDSAERAERAEGSFGSPPCRPPLTALGVNTKPIDQQRPPERFTTRASEQCLQTSNPS